MLVELKKLNVLNEGYSRKVFLDKIFINADHVISIRDYSAASDFLLSEGLDLYKSSEFSLLKLNNGSSIEEMIILGSSGEIFKLFSKQGDRLLLNE